VVKFKEKRLDRRKRLLDKYQPSVEVDGQIIICQQGRGRREKRSHF